MNRSFVLLLLFLFFYPGVKGQPSVHEEPQPVAFSLPGQSDIPDITGINTRIFEVSHGQAFVDWKDPWAWFFSGSYLYQLKKKVALGAGAGLQFDNTGLYPVLSVNSIFGNKSEGFAFGLDAKLLFTKVIEAPGSRIWVTGGVYYKDFFIKMMPTFLFGYPQEWYFETGYSFSLGK